MDVRLDQWAKRHLDLLKQSNTPKMTAYLGGPESEDAVADRHRRYLEGGAGPTGGMFAIVDVETGDAVGSVGYWEKEWHGVTVFETGWGVLPAYQGHGVAASGMRQLIAIASREPLHPWMHAYPRNDNAASNALCRKLGFEYLGEYDFEYPPGNPIRCNDWRLNLNQSHSRGVSRVPRTG